MEINIDVFVAYVPRPMHSAAQQGVRNDLGACILYSSRAAGLPLLRHSTHLSSHSNTLALNSAALQPVNNLCVLPNLYLCEDRFD